MALTLPLLLLVSVGIFEFGRAYQTWQVLTNAAREGARVAVLPDSTDDAIEARRGRTCSRVSCRDTTTPRSTITHDNDIDIGGATATASQVTVSYPFSSSCCSPSRGWSCRARRSAHPSR